MLNARPDKHPIVYLKDVNPKHLEQLLRQDREIKILFTFYIFEILIKLLYDNRWEIYTFLFARVKRMHIASLCLEVCFPLEYPPVGLTFAHVAQ
jgi:hypothetical protein